MSTEVAPHTATAALGRLVLDFRLLTVAIATIALPLEGTARPGLAPLLLAVGLANLWPVLRWQRLAPFLSRHPAVLALDCLVTFVILYLTGADGPFLAYTFGTAFLAGVLYRWVGAVVFSGLLVLAYVSVLRLSAPGSLPGDFHTLVGTPSLYLVFALGAVAVRDLIVRQAEVEAELVEARAEAATAAERARLARELHDTLGKTLHGIVLLAGALPAWARRDPERAEREARVLATSAQAATIQARELLHGLRADRLDRPLHEAVRACVTSWAQATGVEVRVDLQPVSGLDAGARYELFWVLREALRNVERHARAAHVEVELAQRGPDVVLVVADDGRGLPEPPDLSALAAAGHFGIVGMRERARRAGGDLVLEPRQPRGTRLTVRVARDARTEQRLPEPVKGVL